MEETDLNTSSVFDNPPLPVAEEEVVAPFSAPGVCEVILALGRTLTPRWRLCYATAPTPAPVEREQAALQLGVNGLELFLAAQARDGRHAAQLLSDGAVLEKVLGIADTVRPRHTRLQSLASTEEWDTLRREIEALCEERADALQLQRDADLAQLLPLGTWLRTLHLEATLLAHLIPANDAALPSPFTPPIGLALPILLWMETALTGLAASTLETRSVSRTRKAVRALRRDLEKADTHPPDYTAIAEELTETLSRLLTS